MTRIEQRTANGKDFRNSDTTNFTTFQDVTATAGVRTLIGELPITDHPDSLGMGFGGGKVFWETLDDTTTAVREEGEIVLCVVAKDGNEKEVGRYRTEEAAPSGQAAVPSEQMFLPRLSPAGSKALRIYFIANSTDTLDTTDCVFTKMPYYVVYP